MQPHRSHCLAQLCSKHNSLKKYIYLNGLKDHDPTLFYTILYDNMRESDLSHEMVTILYTPTVGDACTNYSHIWRRPEGMYVSIGDKGRIRKVLSTWPNVREVRIAAVNDGSRILGLGDLATNGLPIAVGKLQIWVQVPIHLDVGASTEKYLNDPLYIGTRRPWPPPEMDSSMDAMKEVSPNLPVQFEDFSTDITFKYLDCFCDKYRCFNDDVWCWQTQDTGSVILSGLVNGAKITSQASGKPLKDSVVQEHRILFLGAGSAGIGVAKQLLYFFKFEGMSKADATKQIWGLITTDRPGLQEHKKFFASTDYQGPPLTNLGDIINYVKPTALSGLRTLRNVFTKEVVEAMASHNPRPIIFPSSNLVPLSEADYEDATNWEITFQDFRDRLRKQHVHLPWYRTGRVASKASRAMDSMVEQASVALAGSLEQEEREAGLVYPHLDHIWEISVKIVLAVVGRHGMRCV
ncbi:hypothetical protein EI94DRAFT_1775348 [Lactarius quietus]|nr:hypothetical protein EI94DRAFT_1775348 [Lactarius quietus]